MEQKKTISELYQECKLKQEMEQKKHEMEQQWKKELIAQITKDFFGDPLRSSPPIPIVTASPPVFPG